MVSGAYCITMRYRLSSKWAGRYNILQYSRKMALRNREQCSCFRRGWFELFNCFTQTSSCCKQLALGRKKLQNISRYLPYTNTKSTFGKNESANDRISQSWKTGDFSLSWGPRLPARPTRTWQWMSYINITNSLTYYKETTYIYIYISDIGIIAYRCIFLWMYEQITLYVLSFTCWKNNGVYAFLLIKRNMRISPRPSTVFPQKITRSFFSWERHCVHDKGVLFFEGLGG